MNGELYDFAIERLGEYRYKSPMKLSHIDGDYIANFVEDSERIVYDRSLRAWKKYISEGVEPPSFEAAGPRDAIYFDPVRTKAAIVTCGGLCPGLNDVIRGLVLSLHHHYGVPAIYGIPFGYLGLVERSKLAPMPLTPDLVENWPMQGGTALGSSRGPQPIGEMADYMAARGINILFAVGGDGTQRGALALSQEIKKRGLDIAVVGVPKTIDNDIAYLEKSFGFESAYSVAAEVLQSAHAEAKGTLNGIAIVKLMGRQSGFLAAMASVASGEANFTLIPEAPFDLDPPNGFLAELEKRILRRPHAVVVVAEGAGQKFLQDQLSTMGKDASGNVKLADIGVYLHERVEAYFKERNIPVSVKYIDPSYIVRSLKALPSDRMFCLRLAQNAVHAAMSGRTAMIVGYWNSAFTHVPMAAAVSCRKVLDTEDDLWLSVMQTTGRMKPMINPA
ncbi:MAG: ATP-dependent 6-phosphofructokinase [Candidatus Omnitrophota bacterium]